MTTLTIDAFCLHLLKIFSVTESDKRLEMIAREVAAFYAVRTHEVAFFKIDPNERNATFRWPVPLSGSMTIFPLKTFATSLVALTVKDRQSRINNTFANTHHLRMMEHNLDKEENRIPVQKIISTLAVWNDTPRWVIQVSRKGKTLAEAGLDFTATDLEHLERIAATIGQLEL